MGFDISNHAVDTRFIQETLIAALIANQPLPAEIVNRAANFGAVAARANIWGLRVMKLAHQMIGEQFDAAPERVFRRPKKTGFLNRLLGKQEFEEFTAKDKCPGLPGFDSDLCIWGRPCFIVADTADESLAALDRYLGCVGQDLGAVDTIAKEMIRRLDNRRNRVEPDTNPTLMAMIGKHYPLLAHLPAADEDDAREVEVDDVRAHITAQFDLHRDAWARRAKGELIESELLEEPTPAAEIALTAPYMIINLASQLLPGWMGRGKVWPTMLFERIGVDVSKVFETPGILFAPLVRELPVLEERFTTTIVENYSLGGYVPPEKVATLESLLRQHERELVLAWSDDKNVGDIELDQQASDYKKILEPVSLARRRGYGFIEAAEVYSGILGVMN